MDKLPLISDLNMKPGDKVFIRIDCNVPLSENGQIEDDFRLSSVLATLEYISDAGAIAIIAGAIGRPKGKYDSALVTKPIAEYFNNKLSGSYKYLSDNPSTIEPNSIDTIAGPGDGVILENLRFYVGEESNDEIFAKELSGLAKYYVNDAFGQSHRKQASICAITNYLPSYAGLCLIKEIDALENVLSNGKDPVVAIIGGAKVSDKMKVIEKLLDRCDQILIGGAMAFTFLKSQGKEIGKSLCEDNYLDVAKKWLDTTKIIIPTDFVLADSIDSTETSISSNIEASQAGFDIGPETIETFGKIIDSSNTILWNGPMGVFEKEQFATGTQSIGELVANAKAYSVVGGGDSVSAIRQMKLESTIDHVSTGGGATLEYIEQGTLVGIKALQDSIIHRSQK